MVGSQKKRILTGVRPTGALHLGHYVGALDSWLKLQDQYECYFLIADYQALGDHFHEIDLIRAAGPPRRAVPKAPGRDERRRLRRDKETW